MALVVKMTKTHQEWAVGVRSMGSLIVAMPQENSDSPLSVSHQLTVSS